MGCEDRFELSLRPRDGRPAKDIVIELDIDGAPVTCTLATESDEPRACNPQVSVVEQEIQHCRRAGCKGTGRFEQLITVAGTPKRVRTRIKRSMQVVGEKLFVPRYGRVRPNGPGCPPVCQQARRTWLYR
jgi:hypothetical protein